MKCFQLTQNVFILRELANNYIIPSFGCKSRFFMDKMTLVFQVSKSQGA